MEFSGSCGRRGRKAISYDLPDPLREADLRAFLEAGDGVLRWISDTSPDSMRAEIVGVALAHRPEEAVYVPVAQVWASGTDAPEACLDLLRPA
jgi:hypothetical protein